MIEQTSNPNTSIAGLKGLKGKAMKGGLFAKFLAAFQKQTQNGENGSLLSGQAMTTQNKGILSKNGMEGFALHQKDKGFVPGMQSGIPLQVKLQGKDVASAETMKEALFASFNGENNLSVSKEKQMLDEDQMNAVIGLGMVQTEQVSLLTKNTAPEALLSHGEGKQGKNNLFANQQQGMQQNLLNVSKDASSIEEKLSADASMRGQLEKHAGLLSKAGELNSNNLVINHAVIGNGTKTKSTTSSASATNAGIANTATSIATPEKGSDIKGAPLTGGVFGHELQKRTSESVEKPVLVAKSEDVSGKNQLKFETGTAKEVKISNQANIAQSGIPVEGDLEDGLRVSEQRVQNLTQRAPTQLTEAQLKAAMEHVGKQAEQADAPVNPLIQSNKVRSAAQAQQAQFAQVVSAERMGSQVGDQSLGSSQQDSSSSQQQETLLGDMAKTDSKSVRGNDFSMQMSQKSGQVYKPAEAMLEIARSAKDGSMKLELQLEPAHLGKVQITLQSDAAKQLQVHIAVDQAASRQVLEQQLPQLRLALAQQGLELGQFSMGMNSQGQQDGSSGNRHSAFHEFSNFNGTSGEEQDGSSIRLGINTASDGRINILA